MPATVALPLARQARREAYASGGFLTGGGWLRRGGAAGLDRPGAGGRRAGGRGGDRGGPAGRRPVRARLRPEHRLTAAGAAPAPGRAVGPATVAWPVSAAPRWRARRQEDLVTEPAAPSGGEPIRSGPDRAGPHRSSRSGAARPARGPAGRRTDGGHARRQVAAAGTAAAGPAVRRPPAAERTRAAAGSAPVSALVGATGRSRRPSRARAGPVPGGRRSPARPATRCRAAARCRLGAVPPRSVRRPVPPPARAARRRSGSTRCPARPSAWCTWTCRRSPPGWPSGRWWPGSPSILVSLLVFCFGAGRRGRRRGLGGRGVHGARRAGRGGGDRRRSARPGGRSAGRPPPPAVRFTGRGLAVAGMSCGGGGAAAQPARARPGAAAADVTGSPPVVRVTRGRRTAGPAWRPGATGGPAGKPVHL